MKTKIRHYKFFPRLLALCCLVLLVLLSLGRPLDAQQFAQGYGAEVSLQRGMIVQLVESDTSKVEPVKASDPSGIHGVVIGANDAPVTLSAEDEKVFVATTGRYEVLVSDQAGPISNGDLITISGLDGIGMKADEEAPYVIGKALNEFNGSNPLSEGEVAGRTVKVGRVDVDLTVAANPLFKGKSLALPSFLQNAVSLVSDKPVSPARAYASVFIAAATVVVTALILYSGIRSSITAIGRNPLSRKSIVRSMIQVVITGLIIFISGLFAVYLLLKL